MESESIGFSYYQSYFFIESLLGVAINSEVIISGILILILLCCSALVSGSEVAYFSLTHNDIEDLKKENGSSPASQRVLKLMKEPAYLLATILIANNFINIGIIVLSIIAFEPLQWFTQSMAEGWTKDTIDFIVTTVTVTFFLVLFGEVSPKVYAKLNSLKLSKFMSKIMLLLRTAFYPISSILVKSSSFLESKLSQKTGSTLSADQIDRAIELTVSREKGSEREVDILRSIVQFNNIAVKQIMRSRVDVKALDFSSDFKQVMKQVKDWGLSRVPVFDEDFDNITGILHVKDLLKHLDNEDEDFEWQAIIRTKVMYVPESKKINDLLYEFQEKRTHLAIVVDEYGGSSGIVTLEDVMEEVIGEIQDEFDVQREIDYQKINTYTYIFEGKTMLHDISKLLDIDMEVFEEVQGEADSLAGLLLEMFGFIPPKGKSITYRKYTFEVVDSTGKRIKKVKMVLPH